MPEPSLFSQNITETWLQALNWGRDSELQFSLVYFCIVVASKSEIEKWYRWYRIPYKI